MGKNICKALFWGGLYIGVQIILSIIMMFFDIINGTLDFSAIMEDSEKATEQLTQYSDSISLPILIVTGIIVGSVYLIFRLTSGKKKEFKKCEVNTFAFMGLSGFACNFIVSIIMAVLILLFSLLVPDIYEIVENAENADPLFKHNFFVVLLGVGIVVPIMEEIVFRYGICGTIGESNRTLGIVLSSVLFGLAHGNFIQTIYTGVFGLFLAFVYTKHKNLALPVIAHITMNSLTVIYEKLDIEWIVYYVGPMALIGMIVMFFSIEEIKKICKLPPKPPVKARYIYPNQNGYCNYYPQQNGYCQYPQNYSPNYMHPMQQQQSTNYWNWQNQNRR